MADFFRSALGYIGNVAGTSDNEFVGQNVELGQQKYRVKRLIAEGGRLTFSFCCARGQGSVHIMVVDIVRK